MSKKRAGIFQRIGFLFNETKLEQYVREFLTGADIGSNTDNPVNDTTAMKYTAVYACCRILAETFASTPIKEYKKLPNGDREETDDTGLNEVLRNIPNKEMGAYNFHELSMYQLNLKGNFICKRIHNRFGEIVGLYPYDMNKITIKRNRSTWRVEYHIQKNNNTGKIIKHREQLYHVVGNSLNGIVGLSPISYAASAIRLGLTYEEFGQRFYNNGAFPTGTFHHPSFLKPEAYARLKKDLEENWQSMLNAGKPMLLEDDLDFKAHSINPVDAQLLESKRFQIEDICRMYRMPLHLVQDLQKATMRNIEHQSLEFAMYTMLPHFKRHENSINTQLLTYSQRQAGYYMEFNMAGLMRGDQKAMADAFAQGRRWGWLSVNDIRRLINLNAVPNGNIYIQPLNYIEAGKEVEKKLNNKIKNEIEAVMDAAQK